VRHLLRTYIFAGVPGCGKTSVIKHVVKHLQGKKAYVKVDVFFSEDEKKISADYKRSEFSEDICPDHYMAFKYEEFSIWAELHEAQHLLIETAGLCFRCAPFTKNAVGIAILDATGTDPRKMPVLLKTADIVVITKYDLISQAERDILKYKIQKINPNIEIFEVNGISGEGSYELAQRASELAAELAKNPMELRYEPPVCICEFCYGSKKLTKRDNIVFIHRALELAKKIPKLNCGACGYEICNLFIRKVLRGEEDPHKCIYYRD
jgi:Ni2+-binding GTPase involved in maturation of urease and hydrogenase